MRDDYASRQRDKSYLHHRGGPRQRLQRRLGNDAHHQAQRFWARSVLDNYAAGRAGAYIDWTPFFHTWELKGRYPRILDR
ncbi:MAG: vitamin B12 dependent-methionine synthase activation domain-containing protein [Hymenobacter sp.]